MQYVWHSLDPHSAVTPIAARPPIPVREWTDEPLMSGLDRLLREIGAYLEFVDIARGS